jgi:hypothetical protein
VPSIPPCVPGQVSIRATGRRPLAAWRRGSDVSRQAALPRVETSPCTAIAAIGASHKTPGSTSSDASEKASSWPARYTVHAALSQISSLVLAPITTHSRCSPA